MSEAFDLLIRGATLVSHAGRAEADLGVRDGRTAAIGDLGRTTADRVIDARGLHVLPGVIDSQVHFREPGGEHKEDLETGGRAAVAGGVTAVFEMPNTRVPTTNAAALSDKLARARGRMYCDHAFYVGATAENVGLLSDLEQSAGCSGVKMFMGSSTGNLLVAEEEQVAAVLRSGRRRVSVHSEDEARLRERHALAGSDVHNHPVWRDAEAALRSTTRLIRLARAARRRVHVLHVSTAEEIPLLAANKDIATVEVTPQHLTLTAPDCYDALGTYAQMNPPLREARHREALWRGIADGVVDVLGSDHAPHTRAEKDAGYPDTPSGMPGVQTLVPIMLDHVHAGRLSLERLVDLTSHGPHRVFGLAAKGRIAVGFDADYTLVDLGAERMIENAWIESRCGWTPFDGRRVTGWPVGTVVRGHVAMWQGEIAAEATGAPIRFQETL